MAIVPSVSKHVSYRSFGYLPRGRFLGDLYRKVVGHPNLMKRLQARDIMNTLALKPDENVLDFACGSGYITVEIAKQAKEAIGIDISPLVEQVKIPERLKSKLSFIKVNGEDLPFEDNSFDVLFASEIIGFIPDPNEFIKEWKRVLKPGGRLVLLTGTGRPPIRRAYENESWLYRFLKKRYPSRFPKDYMEYEKILNRSFGNQRDDFMKLPELEDVLGKGSFKISKVQWTPGRLAANYFAWMQFILYLRKGETLGRFNFVFNYILFSIISFFDGQKSETGVLISAENVK